MTQPALMSAPRLAGALEALDAGVALGWARDAQDPGQKLVVEILCDGFPVALDRADIGRDDLGPPGSVLAACGFQIELPKSALLAARRVTARLANTDVLLEGELEIGEHPSQRRQRLLRGEVKGGSSLRLAGWVATKAFQHGPPKLRAFEADRLLAETEAVRPLSPSSPGSEIALGFHMHLPLEVADGTPHEIRVVDDAGADLGGSPLVVAVWPAGPADLIEADAHVDGGANAARAGLAAECLRGLTLRMPASVGFASYAAWSAAFPPRPVAAPKSGTDAVTVAVYGHGDLDVSARSVLAECSAARIIDARSGGGGTMPQAGVLAVMQAGDTVKPGGLGRLACALRDAQAAYTDSEQWVDGAWRPWFKPGWDPDLFMAQGYVFGLLAVRAGPVGSGATDPLGWAIDRLAGAGAGAVEHIPEVLYAQARARAAGDPPLPDGWLERRRRLWPALGGGRIVAQPQCPWLSRLEWQCPDPAPTVAAIIPTRDGHTLLRRALDGLEQTDYPDLRTIVLDNGSTCPETVAYLDELRARDVAVMPAAGPFNYARLNNLAAARTGAEIVCLLNNDVEVVEPSWLREMVGQLTRPGVGAVGAKLLWPNDMVQHAGVALGVHAGAEHMGLGWHADDTGYCCANLVCRQVSAVTAACLLVRRADYLAVGGMDEQAFPVAFNDVDLCLKIRAMGRSVVWTPHARLVHRESATRGADDLPEKAARLRRELANLRARWPDAILSDPFYNPNLNADGAPFEGLALPPRRSWR